MSARLLHISARRKNSFESSAHQLVARVRAGESGFEEELEEFIERTTRPYLELARKRGLRDQTLSMLFDVAVESIRGGALLRPEFLTSFLQTLAWQHVKRAMPSAVRPGWEWVPAGGVLVPGRIS